MNRILCQGVHNNNVLDVEYAYRRKALKLENV